VVSASSAPENPRNDLEEEPRGRTASRVAVCHINECNGALRRNGSTFTRACSCRYAREEALICVTEQGHAHQTKLTFLMKSEVRTRC